MKMNLFVYASDLDASARFYEALGGQPAVDLMPGIKLVRFWNLSIMVCDLNKDVPAANDRIQIEVDLEEGDDLDEYHATCKANGLDVADIIEESFGRIFWVRDPDGVSVQMNAYSAPFPGLTDATA